MACKRAATTELNHDNWDNEEEPEDPGTFVKAPPEVLEKRVVKAARRRLVKNQASPYQSGNTKSPFNLFSGFKTTTSTESPFTLLAKTISTTENSLTTQNTFTQAKTNVGSNGSEKGPMNGMNKPSEFSAEDTIKISPETKAPKQGDGEDGIFKKSSDYFAKLKGLNESVTQWIKSHVDANPFCILTPIFRDYERYIKEIEAKHSHENLESSDDIMPGKPLATSSKLSGVGGVETATSGEFSSEEKKSTFFDSGKPSTISNASVNWSSRKPSFGEATPSTKNLFESTAEKQDDKTTFGSINTENNPFLKKNSDLTTIAESTEKSSSEKSSGFVSLAQSNATSGIFSFGQNSSNSTLPKADFSFGSGKPFSFGSYVAAPKESETKAENDEKEEDEEPPKPDFKPITEDDAFFEIRCKVFVKKDGNFSDRGVGVLFLKPTPNGKTQLVVRGDNSLGNLLLNTLLTTSIPTKRMSKNTVMLVCLPMPDSQPPPTAVLLRVKTSEDADSLIETLDKNKK